MSQPKPNLNIAIAGGSLGGLIHGIVLLHAGHNITILERRPNSAMHGLGAGLSCAPEMQEFMAKYDLTNEKYGLDTNEYQFLNSKDEVIRHANMEQRSTTWDVLYYRLRANFDGLRSGYCSVPEVAVRKGVYRDGCTVLSVKEQDAGVRIEYRDENGSENSMDVNLLIAADGPSSRVRDIFLPDVERKFIHIRWRGTVPLKNISAESQKKQRNIPTHAYPIPGPNGSLDPKDQLFNWVWYQVIPQDSAEYTSIMTNKDGNLHHVSVPLGKMSPSVVSKRKSLAAELLSPSATEIVQRTKDPYIQAITDCISPKAVFLNGKVLLAGDAVASLRPMAGLGVNSAARSAMILLDVLGGKMGFEEWEKDILGYARDARALGITRESTWKTKKASDVREEGAPAGFRMRVNKI
ncbi:FAD/NAD(P)-binding domain-containing protein [Acephala macrosclerotiorum]|nr:FAD/NAD(P)-binding domain-containing protein [Acephala macrosclerotiorum]